MPPEPGAAGASEARAGRGPREEGAGHRSHQEVAQETAAHQRPPWWVGGSGRVGLGRVGVNRGGSGRAGQCSKPDVTGRG